MTDHAEMALDFTLLDTRDKEIKLSEFIGKKNILLVLVRGFA